MGLRTGDAGGAVETEAQGKGAKGLRAGEHGVKKCTAKGLGSVRSWATEKEVTWTTGQAGDQARDGEERLRSQEFEGGGAWYLERSEASVMTRFQC